jgi:hypothetical protein
MEKQPPRLKLPSFLSVPEMRYQNAYVWLVLVASLDLILTMLVLYWWGGSEVNPIADAVIAHLGYGWAIVFKFSTIIFVIIICEVVGRREPRSGRSLAIGAVVINAIPVAFTIAILLRETHRVPGP